MHAELRTLLVAVSFIACGRERVELIAPRSETSEPEPIDVPGYRNASMDAGAPSSTSLAPQAAGESNDDVVRLELPPVQNVSDLPLVPADEPPGCRKADFLFVVDNSSSMEDKQSALSRSFPRFMSTLEGALQIRDFRVMAVDTDGERLDDLEFPVSVEACDDALGAGRRVDSAGNPCGIANGLRFMGATQEDLPGTFACAAAAGDSGSNIERPVEAALTAISRPFNEAGGCNEAFLRDDAILVVTWITDEDDERSDDDPPDWHADLLAAKHGQEEAIVPLGLLGPQDRSEVSKACDEGDLDVEEAPRLHELVSGFEAGYIGDICSDDYSDFFAHAVEKVSWSCERFEPIIR